MQNTSADSLELSDLTLIRMTSIYLSGKTLFEAWDGFFKRKHVIDIRDFN